MPLNASEQKNFKLSSFSKSCFLAAIGLFVCFNFFLAAFVPIQRLSAENLPKKNSWECHRALRFVDDSKKIGVPQVVLFGSSLMMIPSTCAEADYLNKIVDPVVEPYSYLMDHLLRAAGKEKENTCFNFALPGAMVSDHYMVSRTLFNGDRKIKLAVLGISLRDFIDCSVDCAAATPAYNYFQRYLTDSEVEELLPLSMPSVFNRGEYLVNKYFYLFGKRLELMKLIDGQVKLAVHKSLSMAIPGYLKEQIANKGKKAITKDSITNVDNILSAQDIRPGSYLIPPNMQLPWQDNTREYKKRFKSANQKSFEVQSAYLDKLIEHHRKLGITTMLVNMPLTEANMKLMPEGSYSKYMAMLNQVSKNKDVVLLELNDGTKFDIKCFRDTVHMNGLGGKRLMSHIAEFISKASVTDLETGEQRTLISRLNLDKRKRKVDLAARESTSL